LLAYVTFVETSPNLNIYMCKLEFLKKKAEPGAWFCYRQVLPETSTAIQEAKPETSTAVQEVKPETSTAVQEAKPEASTAVQEPSLDIRPHLESSQTRFKTTLTNQHAPFDHPILKLVTKIVTQRRNRLDKAVNDARRPDVVKPHSNIWTNHW